MKVMILTIATGKRTAFVKLKVKSSVQSKDMIELLLASKLKHLNYHKCSIKPVINLEKRLFFNTCALINTL